MGREWERLSMSKQQRYLVSSRRCHVCGGTMHYQRTWVTWLTHRYVRQCSDCGHIDATSVRLWVIRNTI